MKVLLYGLQRSGTNYLEVILKRYYSIKFLNDKYDRSSPLHKHFRLYDDKQKIPEPQYFNEFNIIDFSEFENIIINFLSVVPDYYIVISKNPFSWLKSYERWARKCNWPRPHYPYIWEYNYFYGKWYRFSSQTNKIIFVRYIDLLSNLNQFLKKMDTFFLRRRLINLFGQKRIKKVSHSKKFTNENNNYYLSKSYLQEYSQSEINDIREILDKDLISFLNY